MAICKNLSTFSSLFQNQSYSFLRKVHFFNHITCLNHSSFLGKLITYIPSMITHAICLPFHIAFFVTYLAIAILSTPFLCYCERDCLNDLWNLTFGTFLAIPIDILGIICPPVAHHCSQQALGNI